MRLRVQPTSSRLRRGEFSRTRTDEGGSRVAGFGSGVGQSEIWLKKREREREKGKVLSEHQLMTE